MTPQLSPIRAAVPIDIYVEDTGDGIAAEHLPHSFDRFYPTDTSRSRDAGGSGIGLTVARAIAQAHGGPSPPPTPAPAAALD